MRNTMIISVVLFCLSCVEREDFRELVSPYKRTVGPEGGIVVLNQIGQHSNETDLSIDNSFSYKLEIPAGALDNEISIDVETFVVHSTSLCDRLDTLRGITFGREIDFQRPVFLHIYDRRISDILPIDWYFLAKRFSSGTEFVRGLLIDNINNSIRAEMMTLPEAVTLRYEDIRGFAHWRFNSNGKLDLDFEVFENTPKLNRLSDSISGCVEFMDFPFEVWDWNFDNEALNFFDNGFRYSGGRVNEISSQYGIELNYVILHLKELKAGVVNNDDFNLLYLHNYELVFDIARDYFIHTDSLTLTLQSSPEVGEELLANVTGHMVSIHDFETINVDIDFTLTRFR